MRFLFVYQDFAAPARQLIERLSVCDVLVIIARNNPAPSEEEMSLLALHRGAPAAACQVNRKYRKVISPLVEIQYEPKKFREDDRQLIDWLVPRPTLAVEITKPSVALITTAGENPRLILAPNALERADELDERRWAFVGRAARTLGRYSNGHDTGPLREWKAKHGVDFAANGRVRFSYTVHSEGSTRTGTTEWHLKEGDNTCRTSAARIYFERVELQNGPRVLVFYCGPHPEDGDHSVSIAIDP